MSNIITINTADNGIFRVLPMLIEKSTTLTNLIEDTVLSEEDPVIELNSIERLTMTAVLDYLKIHLNDVVKEDKPTDPISEVDEAFIGNNVDTIFKIIEAANFLDIKPLLEMGCKKIANLIKGKSTAEMRTILSIENDFTPQEEADMKKENEWVST